jgi:hypothetical protein
MTAIVGPTAAAVPGWKAISGPQGPISRAAYGDSSKSEHEVQGCVDFLVETHSPLVLLAADFLPDLIKARKK